MLDKLQEIGDRLKRIKENQAQEESQGSPFVPNRLFVGEEGQEGSENSVNSPSKTPTTHSTAHSSSQSSTPPPSPPSSPREEESPTMTEGQSIKELSTSTIEGGPPLSIAYPNPAEGKSANFEIKGGILHRLPTFHGLPMEDPNKHLKEFQFICGSMTPQEADENIFKLKTFPFSLSDRAKDWLYELPEGSVTSWDAMMKAFLEKFFPASRVIMLRKKITGIQQASDESYPSYHERFKSLLSQCPQHKFKDESLLQYFYEGLLPLERQMLDAASGGSFVDKTPAQGKALIANRAANAQQYEGIRNNPKHVNEVSITSDITSRLDKLTSLVSQVLEPKSQVVAQVCGICTTQGHPTDQCPQLIENGGWESVNYVNNYQSQGQGQPRPKYDPYSTTYNPGWRDHPNFRWRDNDNSQSANQNANQNNNFNRGAQGGFFQRPQAPMQSQGTSPNYERIIEALNNSTHTLIQGQQSHGKDIVDLKKQLGQVVDFMSKFHENGKLPMGTIPNPKGGPNNTTP